MSPPTKFEWTLLVAVDIGVLALLAWLIWWLL